VRYGLELSIALNFAAKASEKGDACFVQKGDRIFLRPGQPVFARIDGAVPQRTSGRFGNGCAGGSYVT
jgi:hypothetical protein